MRLCVARRKLPPLRGRCPRDMVHHLLTFTQCLDDADEEKRRSRVCADAAFDDIGDAMPQVVGAIRRRVIDEPFRTADQEQRFVAVGVPEQSGECDPRTHACWTRTHRLPFMDGVVWRGDQCELESRRRTDAVEESPGRDDGWKQVPASCVSRPS